MITSGICAQKLQQKRTMNQARQCAPLRCFAERDGGNFGFLDDGKQTNESERDKKR